MKKTFTKHILLLALMLFGVAGAAWALPRAPQKFTGPVDIATLQVGDTLAQGFELTGDDNASFLFKGKRAKENGELLAYATGYMRSAINGYGSNGSVNVGSYVYTPVLEDQTTDGNAWVVVNVETGNQLNVTVAGIRIAPDPTVPALDELTGNWNFTMPGSNKVVKVTYKAQPALAWTFGGRAIPNDTTITAYRGFELPVIGSIGAIMDHDFLIALLGGTVSLRYGSTNPAVISFTDPNDMWSVSVNGAGECNVYMVFDGNDDFQDDSVAFHAVIAESYTLTLAANDGNMGTVSALVGGGEETLLTTITATGLTDYSQSPDGIVTVSLNNISNYSSDYGWIDNGTVTVEAPQGYTITRCVFRQYDKTPLEDDQAPFTATIADYTVSAVTSTGQVYGVDVLSGDNMDGISSIEVYGYATGSNSIVVLDETAGTYAVIPGAEVQVVATAQDGNYVSAWSDNRQPGNYTSDTNTITVGESMTLTATFAQNPLLTLASNNGGTVTLDGDSIGTVYTFTFEHPGNSEDDRAITIPANRLPYDTTFSYNANITDAYAYDQIGGSVSKIAQGAHTVTVRISGAFEYGGYYSCLLEGGASDDWTISCTTGTGPVTPNGITKTGDNTYRVLPGTQLSVTATPGEGSYLAQWSDQTEPVEGDARLGSSHPYTMPATAATLTATFNEIPVLTLASNNSEWGTVTLDGVTPGPTTYDITIEGGNTYTNVSFPFTTTVFLHEGLDEVEAVDQTPLIAVKNGNNADITINGPYGGTIEYSYNNHEGVGHKAIFCTAVEGLPIMPEGVTYAGYGNYLVLPGTQVKVIATPDSAHYFVNWNEETALNSNTAVEKTLTMGTAPVELTANFNAKPTLTVVCNGNEKGTMELTEVPQETLLTTINSSSPNNTFRSGSRTFDSIATVTFSGNVENDNNNWGWWSYSGNLTMTVSAAEGYTITRVKFFCKEGGVMDSQAPFQATLKGANGYGPNTYMVVGNLRGHNGVTKMEVYGYCNSCPPTHLVNVTDSTYLVDYGTTVRATATAKDGYHMDSWSNGAAVTDLLVNSNTITVTTDSTIRANFIANPLLTLASNNGQWGTVSLDGVTYDTVYTITFENGNSPEDSRSFTIPASLMPYDTTFSYNDYINSADAYEPSGKLSISNLDDQTVTIRISGECTGFYSCDYGPGIFDQWGITCTASTVPVYPYGITKTGNNTYRVLPSTEVKVIATPDSAHYFVNWTDSAAVNSNIGDTNTLTMGFDDT